MKDFYNILGTDANSTSTQIEEAYLKLSNKFHPALNQNDKYFETRFREISLAYEILSNPAKRRKYDSSLKRGEPRPPSYSKTKRVDIAFTIMLILITVFFGYYVIENITQNKIVKVETPVVTHVVVAHKRKHSKIKSFSPQQTIVKVPTESPNTVIDTIIKQPVKTIIPVEEYLNIPVENSSYPSYVHANATGLIYLRKLNDYTSAMVEAIPNNAKVMVLERGPRYYKVSYNNETGYIPKWTVLTK